VAGPTEENFPKRKREQAEKKKKTLKEAKKILIKPRDKEMRAEKGLVKKEPNEG